MAVSHLTTGVDALWALVLSEMASDGHTYDTLHLSTNEIIDQIVTDVGGSNVSNLDLSPVEMLEAAVNALAPGTANWRFMGYAELLAALVNALQSVATIQLSAATIAEDASVGDLVGTLSVSNGSGSYTFTLTDDGGGLFALDGVDDTRLEVAAALSDGSVSITVEADNGVDTPISRAFLITITAVVVVPPTAPVLAMDPLWTTADSTPDFTIDIDDTIAEGDDVQLQIQAALGDWSSLVHDSTHTITAPEDAANEIDLSNGALSNGDYEARARVTRASDSAVSDWSNTQSFTIAATSSNLIFGTGNNLLWSTDHLTWA